MGGLPFQFFVPLFRHKQNPKACNIPDNKNVKHKNQNFDVQLIYYYRLFYYLDQKDQSLLI